MPNVTYKTTWFFEGLQGATVGASGIVGWTETWYQTFDSGLPIDYAITQALSTPWIARRLAFMTNQYRLVWVRVSDVANPRNTKLAAINNQFGKIMGPSAQVTCCVLVDIVKLQTDTDLKVHHRRSLFRGLPESMIDGNILIPDGTGYSQMVAFLNYLTKFGSTGSNKTPPVGGYQTPYWQIQYEPSAVLQVAIAGLVVQNGTVPAPAGTPGFNLSVTGTAAIPMQAAGTKVLLKKVGQPRGCNRTWTLITSATGAGPYLLGKSRIPITGTWDGVPGYMQFQAPAYGGADQFTLIGLTSRHTGRPFRLPRGKRSRGSSLL
jgi:hypothetical protein